MQESKHYLSYLLRIWATRTNGEVVWRASLESPNSDERRGFVSLEALFEFLHRKISGKPDDENDIVNG